MTGIPGTTPLARVCGLVSRPSILVRSLYLSRPLPPLSISCICMAHQRPLLTSFLFYDCWAAVSIQLTGCSPQLPSSAIHSHHPPRRRRPLSRSIRVRRTNKKKQTTGTAGLLLPRYPNPFPWLARGIGPRVQHGPMVAPAGKAVIIRWTQAIKRRRGASSRRGTGSPSYCASSTSFAVTRTGGGATATRRIGQSQYES